MSVRKNPKRPNSPWECRWKEEGKHYCRSFKTRKEAELCEAEHKTRSNLGSVLRTADENLTVDVYANRYLDMKRAPKTTERNVGIYRRHIEPFIGLKKIRGIRHSDIQELVNGWVEAGLSPRTVNRQVSVLSKIFALAERDDVISRNPVKFVEKPTPKEPLRYALSISEVTHLLNTIHPNYKAFIYVLTETGMRIGEAIGLNIGDFDWASGTLHIRKSKTKAGIRSIQISQTPRELISQHVKSTGRTMAHAGEPLFVSHRINREGLIIGTRLNYSNFRNRIFKDAATKVGLPRLNTHDFRRTAATLLVSNQVQAKVVQERLGHSDIRFTYNLYVQATPEAHKAAVSLLESLLNESPGEPAKDRAEA